MPRDVSQEAKGLTLATMLLAFGQPEEKLKAALLALGPAYGVDISWIDDAFISRVCKWHKFYLAFLTSPDCYTPLAADNKELIAAFDGSNSEMTLVIHQLPQWIEWGLPQNDKDVLMGTMAQKFADGTSNEREFLKEFDALEEPKRSIALWVWNHPERKRLRLKIRQAGN